MERNKRQDWTDVLRDRLQDAQLPLADGWGASAAASGRARRAWWPVALAGAAAAVVAVVAAVLLLRPQPQPEPTRLVQADTLSIKLDTDSTSVQTGTPDAGQTEPVVSLPLSNRPRLADGLSGGRQPSFRTPPTAPGSLGQRAQAPAQTPQRLPQDSTDVQDTTPDTLSVTPGTLSVTPGLTRSLLAENEIPDQVGDDIKGVGDDEEKAVNDSTKQYRKETAVTPLSEIALADLEEIPGQAEDDGWGVRDDVKRRRAGRVALRVQAGFAGTSLSNGIGSVNIMTSTTVPGQWILAQHHSGAAILYGDNNLANENGQGELIWYYNPPTNAMSPVTVPVRKAPVFPVSFGVSAALPLSRSWVLTAGLDYMQRDGYRVYDYTPQSLTLHYLGIPVDIHYYFNPESRWRFYLGAGVHAGKCIAATGGEPLKDPVLFSGSVMAGTDFRLLPGVRFYLAPAVSGFFNRSAYINTWDERAYFQLRAGLSFDLK